MARRRGRRGGSSIDPIVDPTKNVLDTVASERRRTNDLRRADESLAKERQNGFRREMELRAKHERHVAKAESRRIDALRKLDRLEVRTAAERNQTAVDTLAKTYLATAETLRGSAENIAKSLAAQAEAFRKEIDARLGIVERFQAAGTGKGAGLNAFWGYLLAGAMLVLALVSAWSKTR